MTIPFPTYFRIPNPSVLSGTLESEGIVVIFFNLPITALVADINKTLNESFILTNKCRNLMETVFS